MDILYRRPVVSFCIMMICGIFTAYLSDSFILAAGVSIFILSFFTAFGIIKKRKAFIPLGMVVFFLLGSIDLLYYNHMQLGSFAEYDGKEVAIRGYVISEPELKGEKVSYIVEANSIRVGYYGDFGDIKGKVILSTLIEDSSFFDYGREVEFEGVLRQPEGMRNPGGFDYRRYLAQKGVGATVFSYAFEIEPNVGRKANLLIKAGLKVRDSIVYVIEKSLPHQQAGLLNGMLIGYREGLSEELQDAFSTAGLSHIMAVSGANVAFLILPLAFLFKKLRIRKILANILIIAFLIFFVFITGFEPSVLRAVVMASIMLTASILYREADTYTAIALSCIILLAYQPYMLFNVGFQLSYAAVLSIIMLHRNISNLILKITKIKSKTIPDTPKPAFFLEAFSATLAAQLGVLPITILYFNKISLISIIPNLLAAPLLEIITVLGAIMALIGQLSLVIAQLIGYLNCIFLSIILYITKYASSLPFATIRTITPTIFLVAAYYFAIWFLLWYKPLKNIKLNLRHKASALSIAALFILIAGLRPTALEVVFLDVRQGDSSFIRTHTGKTLLIDGGGSNNPSVRSNIGESAIIPFLLDSHVTKLNAVIATHAHSDHIQGLYDVIYQLNVDVLILPSLSDEECFKELLLIACKKNVHVIRCSKGDIIRLDNMTYFKVLSPEPNCAADEDSLNNTSLVLKLCYGLTSIIFTGDAEKEVEEQLVSYSDSLSADVIKIAHHGSISSTGEAFLREVSPKAAVISVGKNNFGHPSLQVLELLEQNNVKCFRTDECGAVLLISDGKAIKMKKTIKGR